METHVPSCIIGKQHYIQNKIKYKTNDINKGYNEKLSQERCLISVKSAYEIKTFLRSV